MPSGRSRGAGSGQGGPLREAALRDAREETRRVLATARRRVGPAVGEAFVFPVPPADGTRPAFVVADGQYRRGARVSLPGSTSCWTIGRISASRLTSAGVPLRRRVLPDPARSAALRRRAGPRIERSPMRSDSVGCGHRCRGALSFLGDRRLVFSCGFVAAYDTFTRVFGTEGEIRMTNPFHPGPGDTLTIARGDRGAERPSPPPASVPSRRHPAHPRRAPRS